jgi:hypothetical protein
LCAPDTAWIATRGVISPSHRTLPGSWVMPQAIRARPPIANRRRTVIAMMSRVPVSSLSARAIATAAPLRTTASGP